VKGALEAAREALAGESAWLVGGAVRDRILGRTTTDFDIVVDGDVREASDRVRRAAGIRVAFELSDAFGAWRVVAPGHAWQIDLTPLRGGSLEADLRLRDFTVNAIAEPLEGGDPIDPLGGIADLGSRRLRAAGPDTFADDPLRTLRLARFACELGLEADRTTLDAARGYADRIAGVAAERVFHELKRIVASPVPAHGIALMDGIGTTRVLLPELEALRGVEQNHYHHRDVHGHTLEVLERVVELERDPVAILGPELGGEVAAMLSEPLADDLTRGEALRFGALLHDAAKPVTRSIRPDGGVSFVGHDAEGARLVDDVLARLHASGRLRAHVADLTRHHLRLGFLVHERPLSRRALYAYISRCAPVEVDVTLLSVADRLATRGRNAESAIAVHVALARDVLPEALRWHAQGAPAPLVRGDDLARAVGLDPGPALGRLLGQVAEAQFAGEVTTPDEAIALARRLVA
jgi:tRNA nucleotidyltransferase/poly(A) polymerase